MYLADAIVDRSGERHELAGLIPGVAVMQPKLQALGYVSVATRAASPLGPAGTRYRGHQFRYSNFHTEHVPGRLELQTTRSDSTQLEGYGRGAVLGSYVHGHWASNPAIAEAFVAACVAARTLP
jgi:cobyrinic acid a,c-diamide synthase